MILHCLTHHVYLQDNPRVITQRPNSPYEFLGQCYLMTDKNPTEGQHGDCQIEKVQQ